MEVLLYDLRYAVRQMLRQPVFATVAIVTLAIGIGANTAIFSVVNAVLIAPLPLGDPDRLVWLGARSESGFDISVSLPNYYDWEARNTTFDAIGAMRLVSLNLTGDPPERLPGRQVVGDYFAAVGERRPAAAPSSQRKRRVGQIGWRSSATRCGNGASERHPRSSARR